MMTKVDFGAEDVKYENPAATVVIGHVDQINLMMNVTDNDIDVEVAELVAVMVNQQMIAYTVDAAVEIVAVKVNLLLIVHTVETVSATVNQLMIAYIVVDAVETVAVMVMVAYTVVGAVETVAVMMIPKIAYTVVDAAAGQNVVAYMLIAAVVFVCTADLLATVVEHTLDFCLPFLAAEMD